MYTYNNIHKNKQYIQKQDYGNANNYLYFYMLVIYDLSQFFEKIIKNHLLVINNLVLET